MSFYASQPYDTELQQGDLLSGVPFTYFPVAEAVVTLSSNETQTRNLALNSKDVIFIAAKVEFGWGMVLSQTCDVQPDAATGHARKPILMARVRPIKELIKNFKDGTLKETVGNIKNLATAGKSPTVLYLPAHDKGTLSLPRSGVDMLDVQRFSPQDLPHLRKLRQIRLQNAALQALQERCAYCFGRFGAPDNLYYSEAEWAEVQRTEDERRKSQQQ